MRVQDIGFASEGLEFGVSDSSMTALRWALFLVGRGTKFSLNRVRYLEVGRVGFFKA